MAFRLARRMKTLIGFARHPSMFRGAFAQFVLHSRHFSFRGCYSFELGALRLASPVRQSQLLSRINTLFRAVLFWSNEQNEVDAY